MRQIKRRHCKAAYQQPRSTSGLFGPRLPPNRPGKSTNTWTGAGGNITRIGRGGSNGIKKFWLPAVGWGLTQIGVFGIFGTLLTRESWSRLLLAAWMDGWTEGQEGG